MRVMKATIIDEVWVVTCDQFTGCPGIPGQRPLKISDWG
jgi:hypothetical protein